MEVVLTVAVTPNVAGRVALRDPAERMAQYRKAIGTWHRLCSANGYRLSVLESTNAEPAQVGWVESMGTWMSISPPEDLLTRGKGAVEAWMLDAASTERDSLGLFLKVTGRHTLANAVAIMGAVCRTDAVTLRGRATGTWTDTRMFGMSWGVWRGHFFGMSKEIDDLNGLYLERIMAQRLLTARGSGLISVDPFAERPRFRGVSGSTGKRYPGHLERLCEPILELSDRVLRKVVNVKAV